jgi:hypothetical protein
MWANTPIGRAWINILLAQQKYNALYLQLPQNQR